MFPSGRWSGWFDCRNHGKSRIRLWLDFKSGKISGVSTSAPRHFKVDGSYDSESFECILSLSFSDLGNDVDQCRGFREGRGIWGNWTCSSFRGCRGGFQIWPGDAGDAEEAAAESETETTDAVGEPREAV